MSSSPVEAPAKVVRFGLFEFDLESNELRRKGLRLKLQDQQLNLLRILLEHPGTLVTRDELRHRLWKPGTFVEFDHSLNTAMMRLREALGDSSDNPMLIETVPRKGYRFIAPVHDLKKEQETADPLPPIDAKVENVENVADEVNLAATPPQGHSSIAVPIPEIPPNPLARQVSLRRAVLAGLALTLLLMAVLFLFRHNLGLVSSDTKQISSIAVLPMENLSGDSNQDYFADGMTDELIASLARISSLRVISRTTAMEYKGTHESLEKIAHDLHVDAVVEGTVLRSGDRVRITAELVQVSTDRHLWADTYESPLGDILALQNQVAAAIVSQIRIKLTPQDKESLATTRPINAGAFEDYLKGRYYWGKRSEGALDKAIHYFQSATEKDSNYALAYAGLADCYGILGAAIVGTIPTSEVAPKAEAAAKRAVELDPTLAETQTALATVQFNDDWNWKAAETGFRHAIQLNPSYATAHQRYSLYLIAMGRTEESLVEMNRARSLDPLSLSVNFSLGWRLYMARQYDQAISQLLNTLEMDPTYLLAHIVLGQCYEQEGKYSEAITELQKAASLSPDSPPVLAALGHAYAAAGKRAEALQMLDKLKSLSARRYVSPFYLALLYIGLGDREQAVAWLDRGYDDRSNNMIFLNVVPQFDSLRSERRFQDLRHRIGL
jgi:TolB-like protein/DNA-binding winged helix-turn-helix (wHTH) protein/Tfp pilus assembly protein PilF